MAYNVSAVAQNDSNGIGPTYLLNGLTDKGYWYQVGLSWAWPPYSGFNMAYEVFNSNGTSIFPTNSDNDLLNFSGPVNQGDTVLLKLYFTTTDQVEMLASDQNTGAQAYETYSAEAATYFTGTPNATSNAQGFFTGLMTEWWHNDPYYGEEQEVVYSVYGSSISSAWMWIDEWDPQSGLVLFFDSTLSPITYSNPTLLQLFSSNNASEASNAYEFITGLYAAFSASILPSSATLDVDQSQTFNSTVSGGTLPYTYQWYLNGTAVPAADFSSWAFTSASAGSYTIYADVTDSVGALATSNNATVTVSSLLIHDVAVTNVASSKTVVGQGFSASTNVTVTNQGGYTETFNVTGYANANITGSENITSQPGNSTTVTFIWNTTGFAYGNYTLSAYVWPVPGETNTGNNNLTGGVVTVTIPGDVNGDGIVNILDAIILSNSFLATANSRNWNPNADINGDGVVNILDAIIQSNHFLQHYPQPLS